VSRRFERKLPRSARLEVVVFELAGLGAVPSAHAD